MKVLFLHNNFPAQFGHIAQALAEDPANIVVFATARKEGSLPRVHKLLYEAPQAPASPAHRLARSFESAARNGAALAAAAKGLGESGFVPDVVYGHSGWGPLLFARDLWPAAKLVGYYEWYYNAAGSDVGFQPGDPTSLDFRMWLRTRNAAILMDLTHSDWGITPTEWQKRQFPEPFRSRLQLLHDGVDTEYFSPLPVAPPVLNGTQLPEGAEIVTYVARGMEPYRGFPQFMRAAALIQQRRPNAHIVVVGEDRVAYGVQLPPGESHKKAMLAELSFDHARLHFTGLLPYEAYRHVIRASAAHVYLTVPFVLSWSVLEAMAMGAVVIGSDTPPVREVIDHGENGFLVDFFSPEAIAAQVDLVIDGAEQLAILRHKARETIRLKYDRRVLLSRQIQMLRDLTAGRIGWPH